MSRRLGLLLLLPIVVGLAVLALLRSQSLIHSPEQASPSDSVNIPASELGISAAESGMGVPGKRGSHKEEQAVFAITLLKRKVEKHPENAPLRLALAEAYFHRGFFGLATESLDSALALDSSLEEAQELRAAAFSAWSAEAGTSPPPAKPPAISATPPVNSDTVIELSEGLPRFQETQVILPGRLALLGTYTVGWGTPPGEVRRAYPDKQFADTETGNLRETFNHQGVSYENTLAYSESALWGVSVTAREYQDTGDLFGRLIHLKTMISGPGKGTGEAQCPNMENFQGVIWENEDTFEFMALFGHKPKEVRLVRLNPKTLPEDKRLCNLAKLFADKGWR